MTKSLEPGGDWMLTLSRWIIRALIALLCFAIAALGVAIVAVALNLDTVYGALHADPGTISHGALFALVMALLAGSAGLLALGVHFLRLLHRIVMSVTKGDPFAPVNADRLRHMAWTALAIQAGSLVMIFVVARFGSLTDRIGIHSDVSLDGLLVALLLFVLARIFAHGAAMRDDLEGTV
tara:strand:+ start:173 stop:712 length:540 start_codon:yes stop_codon:yes gene_type:complete